MPPQFEAPADPENALVHSLGEAITASFRGSSDVEGRTPVDLIIADIKGSSDEESQAWAGALERYISAIQPKSSRDWVQIETIIVLTGIAPPNLSKTLEEVIARNSCPDPTGRASVYSLLTEFGKRPTARMLFADTELRSVNPVQWLDLVIPVLPDGDARRGLLLDAFKAGVFTIDHFAQRLDEMRSVGGDRLAEWLLDLRRSLSGEQWEDFDGVVSQAFGPPGLLDDAPASARSTSETRPLSDAVLARPPMGKFAVQSSTPQTGFSAQPEILARQAILRVGAFRTRPAFQKHIERFNRTKAQGGKRTMELALA